MVDFVIAGILLVILGAAIIYIVKVKKNGVKCIGCPDSGRCSHGKSGADGNGNCIGSNGNCGGSCAGCSASGGNTKCSCHKDTE